MKLPESQGWRGKARSAPPLSLAARTGCLLSSRGCCGLTQPESGSTSGERCRPAAAVSWGGGVPQPAGPAATAVQKEEEEDALNSITCRHPPLCSWLATHPLPSACRSASLSFSLSLLPFSPERSRTKPF